MKTIFIQHNYILLQLYIPFKIIHISTSKGKSVVNK